MKHQIFISSGPWSFRYPWSLFIDPNQVHGIVGKSITRYSNKGHGGLIPQIRCYQGGYLNRFGLPNAGMESVPAFHRKLYPSWQRKFIPSLAVAPPFGRCDDIIKMLNYLILALRVTNRYEINISCPSAMHDTSELTPQFFANCAFIANDKKLILKVSHTTPPEVIEGALAAGFYIHASNSIPYVDKKGRTWGMSGNAEVFYSNHVHVRYLRQLFPTAHIIFGGGIQGPEQALKAIKNAGADDISLGSVLLRRPWIIRKIDRALRERITVDPGTESPGCLTAQ
jgi:dihydroorotate dehydrogenase